MAVTVFKTFAADEILTASDLNSSLTQFTDNGEDFGTPATKAHDMDGNELIFDSDADSSITASTDDQFDFRIGGVDSLHIGHGVGNTAGFLHVDPGAVTVTANTDFGLIRVGNTNAITIPAGTTAVAAGLYVEAPNWTATGTITTSATIYIVGAATEATTDFALFVDAGTVRIDDQVLIGTSAATTAGTLTIDPAIFTATANTDFGRLRIGNTNALTIPAGTTTNAAALFLEEPNFTATGTITNASTLYIEAAPTEGGTTNHAIRVDSGSVQFDGTLNVTGAISEATSQVNVVGKQTIWVPAAAMRPTVSNGCAGLIDAETTSARPDITVLDFDASADEFAQFQIALPKSWNLGTVTAQFFWTGADTDTGGVTWAIKGVGAGNNNTIDVAFGTQVDIDDEGNGTAEVLYVTSETPALTLGGTPADDDESWFHVSRDVSDTNDDRGTDARLIGIKFFLTTDAKNDA